MLSVTGLIISSTRFDAALIALAGRSTRVEEGVRKGWRESGGGWKDLMDEGRGRDGRKKESRFLVSDLYFHFFCFILFFFCCVCSVFELHGDKLGFKCRAAAAV